MEAGLAGVDGDGDGSDLLDGDGQRGLVAPGNRDVIRDLLSMRTGRSVKDAYDAMQR